MTDNFDIFIANSIYPDAEAIFKAHLKPLHEIKDDCMVILDTNALVVPYTISPKSLNEIHSVYTKLVKAKRLIVPSQVAREFAKQRANKITELFQQLSRKVNSLPQLQKGKYPLLENLPSYQEAIKLESELDDLLRKYRKSVDDVLTYVRGWTWNDPVSSLYAELFSDSVVTEPTVDKQTIKDELKRRQTHHIPPGYKDAGKDDDGIGDLLIWYTILEVGKSHKKNVIFVSGDEKADWWHKSENRALYPRYELTDEFRRYSDGQTFHIISFSSLLDLYDVSEDVIQEVRVKEQQSQTQLSLQEVRVLELAQEGLTNEEIASQMELMAGTVRNYLSSAYEKLDARNRVEAIQKAIDLGVLNRKEINKDEIEKIKQSKGTFSVSSYLGITSRELEVLKLMQKGYQNKEISDELELGEGTVRNYTSSIYEKLSVRNRPEAIQKAMEIGILTDESS